MPYLGHRLCSKAGSVFVTDVIVIHSSASKRIWDLKTHSLDDFIDAALTAASRVLGDRDNPLRLNLCCAAIRMLFEHVMGVLAPDEEVIGCGWYKPFEDLKKPIRAQRIQYWIQGGLTDEFVGQELGLDPEPQRRRLLHAFNNLSKHVHGRIETIVEDETELEREALAVADALEDMFNAYRDCRGQLIDPILDALDEGAIAELLSETIQSVDELASHHSIEEIYPEKVRVSAITASVVRYQVTGTIAVTLQWGSNSDLRRGDGAELDQSFPFLCEFEVPVDDPRDLSTAEVISGVDTSSWRDNWSDLA